MKKTTRAALTALLLALLLLLSACGSSQASPSVTPEPDPVPAVTEEPEGPEETEELQEEEPEPEEETQEETPEETPAPEAEEPEEPEETTQTTGSDTFSLDLVPDYDGEAYVAIHDNIPYFTEADSTTEAFETYSDLDRLGRCGVAYANICIELMPTEARESISSVTPTGWVNNSYDFVDGGWLYNRCHLIGFQLAGENANEKNLITGTRYLNVTGMLPFENLVADYVKETEGHVLYRVTPVFDGDNLLAEGVLMEGWSVEDEGDGVCFCVFAYNVQPGVELDYATGDNWADGTEGTAETGTQGSDAQSGDAQTEDTTVSSGETEYVLNTRSMKFHYPDCSGVASMSESNKQLYTGSREELIAQGYSPCGICKP